jgi:hypothetical protein
MRQLFRFFEKLICFLNHFSISCQCPNCSVGRLTTIRSDDESYAGVPVCAESVSTARICNNCGHQVGRD